ncbi:uncharacterized protein [Ptychodera flava]|uniref:uncharacterized protein n=1 Tax=Ptychodera flava TaxID=63121 RepID=UPI003969CBC5
MLKRKMDFIRITCCLLILVHLSKPQNVDDRCPEGWLLANSNDTYTCYFLSTEYATQTAAISHCESFGSTLVMFKSHDEYIQFEDILRRENKSGPLFIGLKYNMGSSKWRWVDETVYSLPSEETEEAWPHPVINCVLYIRWSQKTVVAIARCDGNHSFICEKEASPDCPAGWMISETQDMCYFLNEEKRTWADAKKHCEVNLASRLPILSSNVSSDRMEEALRQENKIGRWYIGNYYGETEWWSLCVTIQRNENNAFNWYNMRCNDLYEFACAKKLNTTSAQTDTTTEGVKMTSFGLTSPAVTEGASEEVKMSSFGLTSPAVTEGASEGVKMTSFGLTSPAVTEGASEGVKMTSFGLTSPALTEGASTISDPDQSLSSIQLSTASQLKRQSCFYETKRDTGTLSFPSTARRGHAMRLEVMHGGHIVISCGIGYRKDHNLATCDHGIWLPSPPMCRDINECETQTQEAPISDHNAVCINTLGSFEYVCKTGFVKEMEFGFCVSTLTTTGSSSKPEYTGKSCVLDHDEVWGVEWMGTPANTYTEWFKCPNAHGIMRRYCDEHGVWAVPDTTYCVREVMSELERSLNESVLQDIVKTTDLLKRLGDSLKPGETITGGDLLVAKDILSTIAQNKFLNQNESWTDLLALIKHFLEASSNSLNLQVEVQWKQTYGNHGPDGSAVSILSSMEHFGATVYLYMIQTGRDLFLRSTNIDLVGSFALSRHATANRRKKRTLDSNDTFAIHDTVALSSEFIEQFQTNITDLPVATVMFACRNTGKMLPADFRQHQAKRTWVKSITSTRIVKRVNTVALAVSVHPKLENVLYSLDDFAMIRLYKIKVNISFV